MSLDAKPRLTRTPRTGGDSRARWRGAVLPVGWLVLVLGLTAVFSSRPSSVVGAASYVAICTGAAAALFCGARHFKPLRRWPWYLLAAGALLGGAGMAARLLLVNAPSTGARLVPDLVTIPAYLLLISGLLGLLRARRGAGAGIAVDGGLMAVAAMLLSWALLIAPILSAAEVPLPQKVINGTYPTISVAVFFVGALLAMTEVRAIPAFWFLAAAWVGLMTGDLVYALASVPISTLPLWLANAAYCSFYGFLGAAGLHRSMVALSRPARLRVRGYGQTRFLAVAVAVLVPAIVVAVRSPTGMVERAVSASLLAVVGGLVLVRIVGAVNTYATSELRLERQANHDALTALPNRLHLGKHLEQVLERTSSGIGVVFLDLDQFKLVNDNWGHETGDELLVVVAARLASEVRAGELVARVGGDEFVIVIEDLDEAAGALEVADRLLAVFNRPVALASLQVTMTSSVGVAFTNLTVGHVTAEDLLREADTAMYRSKASGGGSVVLFDESMRTQLADRIALESSLREALSRNELQMHYQPIVDLGSGSVLGFEALMRWQHPQRGSVVPTEFIPVAEETGLIVKLGRWAIEQAATQLSTWHAEFGVHLSMSVNLSPRQMRDPLLVGTVKRVLDKSGLPPGKFCLEVTESSLMENVEAVIGTVAALKQLGVRLSADDFGTGYSSLAYLRQFPFDQVKVDRSFVNGLGVDPDDDVIVGAVLSMAKALALSTVAEGVETITQRDRLIVLGAGGGQGWLFSAAMPAAAATQYLRAAAPQTSSADARRPLRLLLPAAAPRQSASNQ